MYFGAFDEINKFLMANDEYRMIYLSTYEMLVQHLK